MSSQEHLASEAKGMPVLGLGTWQNKDLDQCADSVQSALEMGYRHVDTAQIYRNEKGVGGGVAAADVDREDVFLATKVWIDQLGPANVHRSTQESLDKLETDYLDLLYVHWPAEAYQADETLTAFGDLRAEGKIDHIGVSNFEPHHMDEAAEVLGEYPFANQVEIHPLLQQAELRAHAEEHDYELVAYSPLARGKVFDVPEITDIAESHGVSAAQVSLAWLREKGITTIPKATGLDHIEDNLDSLSLDLHVDEIATIDNLEQTDRRVHPDFAPDAWD
jgi:diketogulonate reductase-like aldo/keto reductase